MKGKIIGITSLILVLVLTGFIYFKFYFVFGEGVKAGELNFVVRKGYIFKTYEGRAIQAGFGLHNRPGNSRLSYEMRRQVSRTPLQGIPRSASMERKAGIHCRQDSFSQR